MIPAQTIESCPACGQALPTSGSSNGQQTCPACKTLVLPARRDFSYGDDYPAQRQHHEEAVRRLKQRSFAAWLEATGLSVSDRAVLEVGFGGAGVLAWLHRHAASAYGVEVIEANRETARELGVPADRIASDIEGLPRDGLRFDLVVYCDSFEHLLDPEDHLRALARLTEPGSQALIVAPRSDCLSRPLMGRFWPHHLPDHWVFFSLKGMESLWGRHGWRLRQSFSPVKFINTAMALEHLSLKLGMRLPVPNRAPSFSLNFGEMGVLMERDR